MDSLPASVSPAAHEALEALGCMLHTQGASRVGPGDRETVLSGMSIPPTGGICLAGQPLPALAF